jgi:hypothetical protein
MPANRPSSINEGISFRGRCEYEPANNVLYCLWNEGFFSNCTVTLMGLIQLFNDYLIIPDRIDFSRGFSLYRDAIQVARKTDLYPQYFQTHSEVSLGGRFSFKGLGYHNSYRFQNLLPITPFIDRFFQLAPSIKTIESGLISKYQIDYSNTLGVCYRGAEKKTEVVLADPRRVMELTERLLDSNSGLRVWIQTEVRQISDLFLKHFGQRCFAVQELPLIDENQSTKAMFSDDEGATRRFAFGQNLLAVTHMLSQCGWMVNHTGNMAYWIWLFRGNSERMWQFDRRGKIVSWRTPIRELWDRSRSFYHYRIARKK